MSNPSENPPISKEHLLEIAAKIGELEPEELIPYLSTLIAENIAAEKTHLERQKSDFIAIASHELRTPLGLILGHATFLREIAANETYQRQIGTIVKNAEKLKAVVEELSNIDNLQSGTARIRWAKLDLNQMLAELVQNFKPIATEKEITLQYLPADQDIWIAGEQTKLATALGNIIENGVVFTNLSGKVTITTELLTNYVRVTITDNGIGIPESDLERIFERFYQVEEHLTRRHGGMGLGLAVSKGVIESHNGHILVESTIDQGSEFSVLLPLNKAT